MKRAVAAVLVILGCASAARGAKPGTLTTLHAIHALNHTEAQKQAPVAFEATVTYYNATENDLFVQDGEEAVYVEFSKGGRLVPGDRVLVEGRSRDSFRPDVVAERVTLLRHGALPEPVKATFDKMIQVQLDCLRVKVRGIVRSFDVTKDESTTFISMRMAVDGGYVDGFVMSDDPTAANQLLDADVEVTGIVSGSFDSKMQMTGIELQIGSLSDIRVVRPASAKPWVLPVMPMDQVLSAYRVVDLTQRVRVHGTITYYQPGAAVVLQDSARSIWITTRTRDVLTVGDEADATGFPDSHDHTLMLTDGAIRDSHIWAPVHPQQATWHELGFWSFNNLGGYQNDLVSIEGQLVTESRLAAEDQYVLLSGGRMLIATYHHPQGNIPPAPMKWVPPGSKIRVTGICLLDTNTVSTGAVSSFNILLRSSDDILVVARPSMVNVRSLLIVVGILIVAILVMGARGWSLDRKVKQHAMAIAARTEREAQLERQRSALLEKIHGNRSLDELLKEITDMVSLQLEGAPCWCRTAHGSDIGIRPADLANMRVVREQIPFRSVSPLAEIFVALDARSLPAPAESEVISMAAGLAFLAIETKRVYMELFHRSEFDLLTGLHNRFSFERTLHAVLEDADETVKNHGIIYIDLDDFKSINDGYGHRVGDTFLQAVSQRMKSQLRNVDLMARHGGDEFIALIPAVRSKTDVEEVAERLKRCFDEPFLLQGCTLQASGSVGVAMYPEDGTSLEALLTTADAAMYVAKQTRRERQDVLACNVSTLPPRVI
jgi:diguanylate cyclase (GGDEF)-like protein